MFLSAKNGISYSHPKLSIFLNNNFLPSQKQIPTKTTHSLKYITYCLPKSKFAFL